MSLHSMLHVMLVLSLAQFDAGWSSLPGTQLQPVCPPATADYDFTYHCPMLIAAWNSAAFDPVRNRLILFGGGHADYAGNELYALELDGTATMKRLTDPSTDLSNPGCSGDGHTYPDGLLVSRHTYDSLAYLSHVDRFFAYGGSRWQCGYLYDDTWTYDFQTKKWSEMHPTGQRPQPVPGIVTGYDPVTKLLFAHDQARLYSYDVDANSWALLSNDDFFIDYHLTGVVDPDARRFYIVGAGSVHVYDLEGPNRYVGRKLTTTGGAAVVDPVYPGLTYNSQLRRVVAWAGGDSVYSLNADTNAWDTQTAPGGFAEQQGNGTFKRFAYVPKFNGYVLVNSATENARFFRAGAPPVGYDAGSLPVIDAGSAGDAGAGAAGDAGPADAGEVGVNDGGSRSDGGLGDAVGGHCASCSVGFDGLSAAALLALVWVAQRRLASPRDARHR